MCPTRAASCGERGHASLAHEHAPALLSAADVDFINGLRNTAARDVVEGRDLGGLLKAISHYLDVFEQDVGRAGTLNSDEAWPTPPLSGSWGPVTAERDSVHGNTVRISGPGPGDHFEVVASSPTEAIQLVKYVAGVDAACQRLKEIARRCLQLVHKRQEVEEGRKRLKQPAETTVNDHIRLLRQYNKTKDIGQQLIGLIAENRGVPVGSLYVHQDYGVGPED